MISVQSDTAPALFRDNGKLYIIPVMKEVPEGTTFKDIFWVNAPQLPAPTFVVSKVKSESTADKTYLVSTYPDGRMTCTCPGFTFRKFCKHTGAKK